MGLRKFFLHCFTNAGIRYICDAMLQARLNLIKPIMKQVRGAFFCNMFI